MQPVSSGGRERAITQLLDLERPGLEIGPSYNPIVPKGLGVSVESVDHASRDELVDKYAAWGHPQDLLDKIDQVDHVWHGGSLLDVIPARSAYGWIVGSHVLEHVVDIIQFLRDCSGLLEAAGRAAFAVPDMRHTFDILSPLTTVGMAVDRNLMRNLKYHSPGAVLDAYARQARFDGELTWSGSTPGELSLTHDAWGPVLETFAHAKEQSAYVDIHRWVFTPTSFVIFMDELRATGLTDLSLVETPMEAGHEFYVTLGRGTADAPGSRIDRYKELLHELAAAYGAFDVTDKPRSNHGGGGPRAGHLWQRLRQQRR